MALQHQYRGDGPSSESLTDTPAALRYRAVWLLLGWSLVIAVVWLSLAPQQAVHATAVPDKVGHLLAYLALALWFGALYRGRSRLALMAGLVSLGAVLELLQALGAVRHAEAADLVANVVGVVAGSLVPHRYLAGWMAALDRACSGAGR